jgi:uncharacterized protein with PIN domain
MVYHYRSVQLNSTQESGYELNKSQAAMITELLDFLDKQSTSPRNCDVCGTELVPVSAEFFVVDGPSRIVKLPLCLKCCGKAISSRPVKPS